ncbi:MAG: peptidylprolyl isomerase [Bacteroidales bacterium]|nr:peptidylprolyl isomerase [Bacteroidales bacterium]
MAVIGTIRKHSALAVILVGVAIGAFIVSDLFTGKRGGRNSLPPLGSIAGEEITVADYNRRVDDNIEMQRTNQNKENLTVQETFDIRQSTWTQYLNEIIMGKEYERLGINVTTEELYDLVQGPRPHNLIRQYFQDPNTKQYSPQMVINFLQNLDNMKPEVKKQWLNLEKYIKEDRLTQKYQALVAKGYYMPEAFASMDYLSKKKNAEIRYVAIRYTTLKDEDVVLTDKDYEAYYEKNKHLYEQEPSRDLDYVIFEVLPSAEDRTLTRESVYQIYDDFRNTSDYITFVNSTSDKRYDSTWFKKGQLPVTIDSLLFSSPVGTFVSPYEENNAWHMARLMDMQARPDSMKAEHILIAYQGAYKAAETITRTKEQAGRLADSLLNVLNADKTKIQVLAYQLSDDGSAKENNGDLGWFADGNMIGPFNEAVLKGNVGDIVKVETVFGFHVIKITGKKDPVTKIRAAVIDRSLVPSSKTFQDVYTQASSFAGENNTMAKFETAVTDQGLNKRSATYLREMGNSIPGIDYPREIVRWAYYEGIKLGEVSPVFDVGGSYVVAVLTNIREKGAIPLEQMKENIKTFVLNEKKASMIKEKIKSTGSSDIYQIARDFNAKVDTNLTLTFSSRNIPGFGSEFQVIGEVFAMNEGDQSEPIQGNGAVFVVKVDRFYEPPQVANYNLYRDQLISTFRSRMNANPMFSALQKKAKIEDNRLLFF